MAKEFNEIELLEKITYTLKKALFVFLWIAMIVIIVFTIWSTRKQLIKFGKEIVCGSDASRIHKKGFCKNNCAPKGQGAFWCDSETFNDNVSKDHMITYVGEGGCSVASLQCDSQNCPADGWTCMAECEPDPHRIVTEDGCKCSGNWSVYEKKCICRAPFIERGDACIAPSTRQCYYSGSYPETFFACVAPTQEVQVFWKGKRIFNCKGSCYFSLCVASNYKALGNYWYSRGSFQEVIEAKRGRLRSSFDAMGGYYSVCRMPMQ